MMAQITASELDRLCTRLLEAQRQLAQLTTAEIITAVDAVARRLADPAEPERAGVLQSLVEVSGFSRPMAEHLLDRVVRDWTADPLERLVRAEFGSAAPLDGFASIPRQRDGEELPLQGRQEGGELPPQGRQDGGELPPQGSPGADTGRRVRAVAPPLGLHVFSGNVPGVGVTSIVRALLVRSAVLGKTAAGEPALAPAFARLLKRQHPTVGAAVEVVYWPGGDRSLEDAALRHASLVVHYGGSDAIADLRARAPARTKFIEHGPRISFAIVDGAAASADTLPAAAKAMATAVALFDQQGCVSPQLAFVVGSRDDAGRFAEATAAALHELEQRLPRGRIDAGEAAAIREVRASAEFGTGERQVWGPDDLRYTVVLSGDSSFEGSCLNRTLIVKLAPSTAEVIRAAAPFGGVLQTVGLHGFDEDERRRLALSLSAVGATRITTLDAMPWPPPEWHHDGRGPLRELIRWVDLEE